MNVVSSPVRQAVLAIAVALAIVAQAYALRDPNRWPPWLVLAAAAIAAALVAGGATTAAPAAAPAAGAMHPAARLLLFALSVAATAAATGLSSTGRFAWAGLGLWLVAALLGALAARGWQLTPARRGAPAWTGAEFAALAALLGLAALARVLWIADLPVAIFDDEARVAMFLAEAFASMPLPSLFRMGWNTWPMIGLALQGLLIPVAGVDIATLRLSSALMGTLSVLATYLLARQLGGARLALLAGLLYAVGRTGIDFSRLGITHAQVLCLEPLAFWLLWRALDSGRAVHWWLAGVATGWCLFTYNAGQLVPPLVLGWLALGALFHPGRLRSDWRGAALLLAALALTVFPYAWHVTDRFDFGATWDQFTVMARNRQAMSQLLEAWQAGGTASAWAIVSRQVWTTWLGFGVLPGGGYSLGYRGGGMLDVVSAALFVVGLAMALRRLARGRDAFAPYWWLGTVVAGGIATIAPPSFVRMVGILPVLAILAALPLDGLVTAGGAGLRRAAGVVLAGGLLGAAAWLNWQTYFVEFAAAPGDPTTRLARFLAAEPPDTRAALLGAEHHLSLEQELFMIEFPGRIRDIIDPSQALPLHAPIDEPLALILGPTQVTRRAEVLALYPRARVVEDVNPHSPDPSFRVLLVEPEQALAMSGLRLHDPPDAPAAAVVDPFASPPPAAGSTARLAWSGRVYWPSDQPLVLGAAAAAPTSVRIGDAPPLTTSGDAPAHATLTLAQGWQPVRIEAERAAAGALRLTLQRAGAERTLSRWDFRPSGEREGLAATYTLADGSQRRRIDPQINVFAIEQRLPPDDPVRTPFRARWRGALRVDTPGTYLFDAIGSQPFRVRLDGAPLLEVAAVPNPLLPAEVETVAQLASGLHPIEVELDQQVPAQTTRRVFQLFWTPPGGERVLVPATSFVPP